MEKAIENWYPVRKFIAWLEKKQYNQAVQDELESLAIVQIANIDKALDSVAKIYGYQTIGKQVQFEKPLPVLEIVNTEQLELEVFKLRSILSDYARTRHHRFVASLAYRDYSQKAAQQIGERFCKNYPRVRTNRINTYIDETNRMFYTELVVGIVQDILLSPLVLHYGKTPRAVTQ